MVVKTNRIQSMSEMIRRRFHADVRGMRKRCKSLGIAMHDFYNASDADVCILSSDEYETGNSKVDCSSENENYFVDEKSYLELTAQF